MDEKLRDLIRQITATTDKTKSATVQTGDKVTDTTTPINPENFYTPSTNIPSIDLNKYIKPITPQQGWQCPVCGAVMSPWTSGCIRCNGNWGYTPTWKFNPYEITCTTKTNT